MNSILCDLCFLLQQVDTTLLGLSTQDAAKSPYIASMGVYVFKTDILLKLLKWRYPTSHDFGSEIIPSAVMEQNVRVRNLIPSSTFLLSIIHVYALNGDKKNDRHIYSETTGRTLGRSSLSMMLTWPLQTRLIYIMAIIFFFFCIIHLYYALQSNSLDLFLQN